MENTHNKVTMHNMSKLKKKYACILKIRKSMPKMFT